MNKLSDYYFYLPENQIAKYPPEKRGESRLFVLNREDLSFKHAQFSRLSEMLNKNDVLVLNDAKVVNARIICKRKTGALIEILIIRLNDEQSCDAITNRTKRLSVGEEVYTVKNESVKFTIINKKSGILQISCSSIITTSLLDEIGELALPPYLDRKAENIDSERYQTVYSSKPGAIASPTAGLHFTDELLSELRNKEILIESVTLFVSWGTFMPVRHDEISKHTMHKESFLISEDCAQRLNSYRKDGKRIIAVGTTTLRLLESVYKSGAYTSGCGETDIFIHPPYKIKSVDALITNFHTPASTLLMLVASFAGYDLIMKAYREAVFMDYRFFSYGDAMLII
jgi:S-adenosylmethionine:tRNA ribosyltransferase-isomerase